MSKKPTNKELDSKNEILKEMNAALRVLFKKREDDKTGFEEKVFLKEVS